MPFVTVSALVPKQLTSRGLKQALVVLLIRTLQCFCFQHSTPVTSPVSSELLNFGSHATRFGGVTQAPSTPESPSSSSATDRAAPPSALWRRVLVGIAQKKWGIACLQVQRRVLEQVASLVMNSLTEDDLFLFNEAEKLEQEYLRRKQEQQTVRPCKSELQAVSAPDPPVFMPHSSKSASAPQLPPEILKRIEANRAAAQARLHQAAAKALSAHIPLPSTVAPHAVYGSESDAESCSSQASITSYFKPDTCSSCSQPRDATAGSCSRRRQRPLSDVNALSQPSAAVSSQQSICSMPDAKSSRSFQPFAPSSASQSLSRRLPCAACGASCGDNVGCSSGCVLEYPEHPPLRQYQLQLVRGCITRNTLVILPTGLGKTFIAGPLR